VDKFKSLDQLYYKEAHAAVIVYAIDDEASFLDLDSNISRLDEHSNMPKMVKIVVGNKSDVEKERRKVALKDGKRYADQRALEFFETSAKVNDGTIYDLFSTLAI